MYHPAVIGSAMRSATGSASGVASDLINGQAGGLSSVLAIGVANSEELARGARIPAGTTPTPDLPPAPPLTLEKGDDPHLAPLNSKITITSNLNICD